MFIALFGFGVWSVDKLHDFLVPCWLLPIQLATWLLLTQI